GGDAGRELVAELVGERAAGEGVVDADVAEDAVVGAVDGDEAEDAVGVEVAVQVALVDDDEVEVAVVGGDEAAGEERAVVDADDADAAAVADEPAAEVALGVEALDAPERGDGGRAEVAEAGLVDGAAEADVLGD